MSRTAGVGPSASSAPLAPGYLVARDPDDEGRRIFPVTKMNLAAEPPSLAYRLVDDPTNHCARIEWEPAPVEHTATSLLREPVDEDERSERDEAGTDGTNGGMNDTTTPA